MQMHYAGSLFGVEIAFDEHPDSERWYAAMLREIAMSNRAVWDGVTPPEEPLEPEPLPPLVAHVATLVAQAQQSGWTPTHIDVLKGSLVIRDESGHHSIEGIRVKQ